MTFTTVTYGLFLVLAFVVYWSLHDRRWQNLFLAGASFVFYAWWDWRFCGLMLASSGLDFFGALALNHCVQRSARRWILAAAVACNLAILGFFKYWNFFAESLAALAHSVGWSISAPTLHVILPVGISFYTFQSMSYAIDVYRRALPATRSFVDYIAYVSFFPQLVAGPIERATHFLPQFQKSRSFNDAQAVDGCRQMLWGFAKKMILADNLGPIVDPIYASPTLATGPELLVATVAFALQIYCDFSAYSDIATGSARLFGFELRRNFDRPYFAETLAEFWRRWHISLTTWFRDYVYLPLGGNRPSRLRWAGHVTAVFLASGLWHGAAWTFVVWGLFHGTALILERTIADVLGRAKSRIGRGASPAGVRPIWAVAARISMTFACVCTGWVFFRAASLTEAFEIIRRIGASLGDSATLFLLYPAAAAGPLGGSLLLAVAVGAFLEWKAPSSSHPLRVASWPWPARWMVYTAGTIAILLWGTYGTNPFIYFQF